MENYVILTDEMKLEFQTLDTKRHQHANPPKDAYFYFPKGKEVVEFDEKNPTKTTRRIFEAGVEYLPYENDRLKDLNSEIEKYNKNKKNLTKLVFPKDWDQRNTLRFLQATGYNPTKTIEYLIAHFEFREKTYPIKVTYKIMEILNLGFLYGHGRDHKFRPILIINAKVYKKFKDTYSIEEWILAVMYFMEYLVNYLLIPGQVENWNIICDVEEVSVMFLPGDLKKIIEILQCNYRARLYVMYLMNISFFVKALWNMIKGMLDPNTERKIKMLGNDKSLMFEFINKNQVEKKFGGTAQNVENYFFPHIMPDFNFLNEKENKENYLMNEQEYIEFVQRNNNYKKCPYIENSYNKIEEHITYDIRTQDNISIPQCIVFI
jgi:hypothetical protein